jgi:hypothetical protein
MIVVGEVLTRTYTFAEYQSGNEAAYRRGLRHGVALASDLADDAATLGEARRILARACRAACGYGDRRRHPGRPPILDEIRRRLARPDESMMDG